MIENSASGTFATRSPSNGLRWISGLCALYAVVRIVDLVVSATQSSIYPFGFRSSPAPVKETGLVILWVAGPPLLMVAAVGLFKNKRWGWTTALIWAVLQIGSTIASRVYWYSEVMSTRSYVSTTRPSLSPSVSYMLWKGIFSGVESCMFPLLLLFILLRPEISRLWSPETGTAFEVLPL